MGYGVDHHNGGCQEGVKAGPGSNRNRGSRWGDKGASGRVVLGTACWNRDQIRELDPIDLDGIQEKKGFRTEGSVF